MKHKAKKARAKAKKMVRQIEANFREAQPFYRLEFDAREAARRIYAPYLAGGKETVFDFMARLCNLSRHKAKALGMREEHIYQRHADGSYSLKILMIPEAGASDVGGVDGIIIHRTRGIVGHETGEIQ